MDPSPPIDPFGSRMERLWRGFARPGRVPRAAIREALADWDALAPAFLARLEAYIADPVENEGEAAGLLVAIHLFGQMRDTRAYRPLIALVSMPDDEAEHVLGDAVTETLHRVAASVFDGDPAPMQAAILEPQVGEYAAHALLDAHTFLTAEGRIPLGETRLFLERCHAHFDRSDDDEVRWVAWQRAVSYLGLTEYLPLVREAFQKGWISEMYMEYADFEADLTRALAAREGGGSPPDRDLGYFGDAIEVFSHWYGFSPAYLRDQERWARRQRALEWQEQQAALPDKWKHTGRNDPCPCGSGRKYKKCCLGTAPAALDEPALPLS